MPSKLLRRAVLMGLWVLPLPLAGASNPHTVDGQECSAWRPTAPVSERIRQVRTCENFKIANAYKLAEEFEAGSNGLPKDWGAAATWYRETIKLAEGLPPEAMGVRRAEAARQRLAELLQAGGPGLPADPAEAQRILPINVTPGFWEFTYTTLLNGKEQPSDAGGRQAFCVTQQDLAIAAPFSVTAVADEFRAMGCSIEQLRAGHLDAELSVYCEEFYDEDMEESFGRFGKFTFTYQGDAAKVVFNSVHSPYGLKSEVVTTGRRVRAC